MLFLLVLNGLKQTRVKACNCGGVNRLWAPGDVSPPPLVPVAQHLVRLGNLTELAGLGSRVDVPAVGIPTHTRGWELGGFELVEVTHLTSSAGFARANQSISIPGRVRGA